MAAEKIWAIFHRELAGDRPDGTLGLTDETTVATVCPDGRKRMDSFVPDQENIFTSERQMQAVDEKQSKFCEPRIEPKKPHRELADLFPHIVIADYLVIGDEGKYTAECVVGEGTQPKIFKGQLSVAPGSVLDEAAMKIHLADIGEMMEQGCEAPLPAPDPTPPVLDAAAKPLNNASAKAGGGRSRKHKRRAA